MVFITWQPPPSSFLKINLDGSVSDGGGKEHKIMVIGLGSRLIIIEDSCLYGTIAPGT